MDRKGIVLLSQISKQIFLIIFLIFSILPLQAIKFDVKRGSHSVGAHVRDAACYVCWSFARAYSPDVMRTHMITLAKSLIIITVFDREVNIRRAGSAAFQESVGRLGIFPHGIEVVTMADYIAVGNRTGSFLEIAYSIAKYVSKSFESMKRDLKSIA